MIYEKILKMNSFKSDIALELRFNRAIKKKKTETGLNKYDGTPRND